MPQMPGQPISLERLAKRVEELESQSAALWSLLADAYAFRDEKNFAEFLLIYLRRSGGMIDAKAAERLEEMVARGPNSRGGPA
jgi:hypothetical protein